MNDLVQRAKNLARCAHAGQVDKAGRPYIEHVARVAAAVADDPEAEAVAWLHDVMEDCGKAYDWAIYALQGTEGEVPGAVLALTRLPNMPAEEYYDGVRRNPLALRVKLADIADNADESRLALLDEETAARLRKKYQRAVAALTV